MEYFVIVVMLLMGTYYAHADCGMIDSSYLLTPDLLAIKYIDGNTKKGSEAAFSCPRGYNVIGTSRTHCDQVWYIPEKPKCVEIECPVPQKVQYGHIHVVNGNVAKNYTFGSAYSVQCEPGYTVKGNNIRMCNDSGSWSGEQIECTEVVADCDMSDDIGYGSAQLVTNPEIKKRYHNKTLYVIICKPEYHVNGSSLVECGFNGEVFTDIPHCIPESPLRRCPDLAPDISNGRLQLLKESNPYPEYYVECNEGYSTRDSAVLVCQNDGIWSIQPPYCNPKSTDDHIKASTFDAFGLLLGLLIAVIIVLLVVMICVLRNREIRKRHRQLGSNTSDENLFTDSGSSPNTLGLDERKHN